MKVLHTSDWHLGNVLHGRKRYDEYEQFLDWLVGCIRDEQIDVLLIAGDIFDTTAPSNRAQELYYHFLNRVAEIHGLQVVVTGGNHDSPSLLNAPNPSFGSYTSMWWGQPPRIYQKRCSFSNQGIAWNP